MDAVRSDRARDRPDDDPPAGETPRGDRRLGDDSQGILTRISDTGG